MKKIDWRARALKAEKDLAARPTLEKIVEKEVLPWWMYPVSVSVIFCFMWLAIVALDGIHKLETPILQPYPVYINRFGPEPTISSVQSHKTPGHAPRRQILGDGQKLGTGTHRRRFQPPDAARATDCAPGFEPVGGACAQVTAPAGHEIPKDQLGYPKEN